MKLIRFLLPRRFRVWLFYKLNPEERAFWPSGESIKADLIAWHEAGEPDSPRLGSLGVNAPPGWSPYAQGAYRDHPGYPASKLQSDAIKRREELLRRHPIPVVRTLREEQSLRRGKAIGA